MEQYSLYTIGYEGKNIYSFINHLKQAGISTLVDIREIPISRKKGFSKTILSEHLKENNIGYIHLKKLGSPKSLRKKVFEDNDYDYFFKEYSKYLKTQLDIIEELHQTILSETCCLMCFEKEAEYCHRKIVAEEIKIRDGNGLKINHIKEMELCSMK